MSTGNNPFAALAANTNNTPLNNNATQQQPPMASNNGGNPFAQLLQAQPPQQTKPPQSLVNRIGSGALQVGSDLLQGIGEGALQTVHGTGELIRKGGNALHSGLGDTIVPPSGQQALQAAATPDNLTQHVGKTAEDIGEFLLGDAAIKGLSLGDKLLKVGKVADYYNQASPFVKAAMEHVMTAARVGAVTGTETTAKTGDVEKGLESGAAGAVLTPAAEGLGAVAKLGIGKAGSVLRGAKAALTGLPESVESSIGAIPEETQSKLVSTIGDAAEEAGLNRPQATALPEAVSDFADQLKSRAQSAYKQLDAEAPGFQDLRDKIGKLSRAVKLQETLDPEKAEALTEQLDTAKKGMSDLLSDEQQQRWDAADKDWTQFKALQRVLGKAKGAGDLVSGELQDVDKLESGVRSVSNVMKRGNPVDMLQRAFGDHADAIRQTVKDALTQEGVLTDKLSDVQADIASAKAFAKWAGLGGLALIGGGGVLRKVLSGHKEH